MSAWTTLEEIMQDLSVAQGYTVPATLQTYAATGPPAFNIEEEESEHRAYCESEGGGGGDSVTPDYEMIQQMINMVSKKKDEELSSGLDPLTPEFVPQSLRKKINKNVALSSIFSSKEAERSSKGPVPKHVIPIMFKKKAVSANNTVDDTENVSPSQISSPEKGQQYTPSTLANEYFKKYVNNSLIKEQFKKDIWTELEHRMKEIDNQKKLRAQLGSPYDGGIISLPDIACAFDVHLTEHRHLMPGDCIVCIVTAKHGYNF